MCRGGTFEMIALEHPRSFPAVDLQREKGATKRAPTKRSIGANGRSRTTTWRFSGGRDKGGEGNISSLRPRIHLSQLNKKERWKEPGSSFARDVQKNPRGELGDTLEPKTSVMTGNVVGDNGEERAWAAWGPDSGGNCSGVFHQRGKGHWSSPEKETPKERPWQGRGTVN